ncbi:ubx domain-containing [Pyrenophora seminiperda CCB06]|uniref:UBX domain-containing protein 2 n=1 Tax=Pyrenophora seminiperda CCB06 TaxID=1302712 RepID=A0A3M7MES0_9PLEO|nr:ubx domain-containing [Pyrenophora seminiperda CCB06]
MLRIPAALAYWHILVPTRPKLNPANKVSKTPHSTPHTHTTMFHQGSLQSGIALAIQQQKLVACFVRDDGATSNEWEEEWLKSGWLSSLLAQKAVLLRLQAGSTEAGFLAAFSDVSSIPTLVVIQNGQLQVQLKSEVNKNDFINSVRQVLGASPIPGSSTTATSPPSAIPKESTANAELEDNSYGESEPTISTSTPPAEASTLSANAKGKQKAISTPEQKPSTSTTVTKAQQQARDALQKKKREDAEELARIKARIEADKTARKVAAERRKAEREQEKDHSAHIAASQPTITSSRGSQAKNVNLNVRLFDGRTIRCMFPREATLQGEVRSWIDSEFSKLAQDDENINHRQLPPYYFRHILPPQPSRELSAGDESQSLGDIDMAPSATLVLVPVKGYTQAYTGHNSGAVGVTTGLIGGAFDLLSSTAGYVGSTLGSLLGSGSGSGPTPAQEQGGGHTMGPRPNREPQHDPVLDNAGVRVRTLADQRAREPQQFYNGNQLSTEPRPHDDDKRD